MLMIDFFADLFVELAIHGICWIFEVLWSGVVQTYEFIYVKVLKRLLFLAKVRVTAISFAARAASDFPLA